MTRNEEPRGKRRGIFVRKGCGEPLRFMAFIPVASSSYGDEGRPNKGGMSLQKKFILTYILFLVLTSLIFSVSYIFLLRTVKQIEIAHAAAVLEETMAGIESRLRELENITRQISLSPDVKKFLYYDVFAGKDSYPSIYGIINLQNNFPTFDLTSDFVDQIYLIFDKQNLILSRESGAVRIDEYYNVHLKYEDKTFGQWRREISAIDSDAGVWPVQPVKRAGKTGMYLTYVGSITSGSVNLKAHVLLLIREETILDLFDSYNYLEEFQMELIDDARQVLASKDPPAVSASFLFVDAPGGYFEDGDYIYLTAYSKKLGWTLRVGLPIAYSLTKLHRLRSAFIKTVLAEIAVGLILSFFLGMINSRPYVALQIDKRRLEELLGQQKNIIKISFIERLFSGVFTPDDELLSQIELNGIDVTAKRFWVLVLELFRPEDDGANTPMQQNTILAAILDDVTRYFGSSVFVHPLGVKRIGIIYRDQAEAGEEPAVSNLVKNMLTVMGKRFPLDLRCGISSSCRSLDEINTALNEAVRCVEYLGHKQGDRIVFYDRLPVENTGYHYPLRKEKDLVSAVVSGQFHTASVIWEELHTINFVERTLSLEESTGFINELKGTLIRILENVRSPELDNLKIEEMIREVTASPDSSVLNDRMQELMRTVCALYAKRKRSHNEELFRGIVECIHENYGDVNLTLSTAADRFKVSEKYLTTFFREQTGKTFYQFLMEYRMDKALDFLKAGCNIHDCAHMVGYDNPKSFSRAFKKQYHYPPSDYSLIPGLQSSTALGSDTGA